MYPHRIRLRGPWEWEPLARESGPPQRVSMPGPLSGLGVAIGEPVRLRRRFGYPGRLDTFERVWLTFAGLAGAVEVSFNQHALGRFQQTSFEIDITPLLQERNLAELILDVPPGDRPAWDEIALEIRCSAFLRNLNARRDRDDVLHVEGEVAGTSTRPLDLYLLIDGSNAGYQQVAAGGAFQFTAAAPHGGTVRVELVDAATVWHTVELPLS